VRSRRAGFTLIEMVLVVVLLGILVLMAMPRMEGALVRRDLAGARAAAHSMVLRARTAAVQLRKPVTINADTALVWLTVPAAGGGSQRLAVLNVMAEYGVRLGPSAASLVVQPTGLVATGTPFRLGLSKAGRLDSLRVTGFGRVE
jgi:prepilin-type N-terminal cleavage/methylation domain-containing protein